MRVCLEGTRVAPWSGTGGVPEPVLVGVEEEQLAVRGDRPDTRWALLLDTVAHLLSDFACEVSGFGFEVSDFGFEVSGFGFGVSGVGLRV